jgi:two-component system chemotaxis response regulator CheY
MSKQVLDIGNCAPDHAAIRAAIEESFDAVVSQARGQEEALSLLRGRQFHLVLVNRKLDRDYSDGTELVRRIKRLPELSKVPVMLITDFPEYQEEAVKAGAEYGFGKSQLQAPETYEKLKRFLD